MPPYNQAVELPKLNILIYGPSHTKKTWWAVNAAEAGFNVLYLDADRNPHVISNLSKKAQARISYVNIRDGLKTAVAGQFLTLLAKGERFVWDEQRRCQVRLATMYEEDHTYYVVDPSLLTSNDIVVLDSWTALVQSATLDYANTNNIDRSDAEKTEWDGYGWQGNYLSWLLGQLIGLPSHLITIGHSAVYEKYKGEKKNRQLEWQRTQIVSSSGPHASKLPKFFTETYPFIISGSSHKIDLRVVADRDGGSRFLDPKLYDWNDLQFKHIAAQCGIKYGDDLPEQQAFQWFNKACGSDALGLSTLGAKKTNNSLGGNTITPAKKPALNGLGSAPSILSVAAKQTKG